MRRKMLLIIVILFLSSFLFGQKNESLRLVDEFGAINLDELMARLDVATTKFHSALQENPNTKIRIRISGGVEGAFVSAYYNGATIEGYLKKNRGLNLKDFSIDYCNVNKEDLRIELFVASQGENLQVCENSLEVPTETTRFANIHFYDSKFKFVPIEDTAPEFGFSQGDYSRTAFNVLKKLLEKSSENKVYVVAYLQILVETNESGKVIKKKTDKKSLAPKMLQAAKKELVKNGFNISQIALLDGGYENGEVERRLEIYFVPKNGGIPKPEPDYFPKSSKGKK